MTPMDDKSRKEYEQQIVAKYKRENRREYIATCFWVSLVIIGLVLFWWIFAWLILG